MTQRLDFFRVATDARFESIAALRSQGTWLGQLAWPGALGAVGLSYLCEAHLFPRLPTPAARREALSGGACGLPCPEGAVLGTVAPQALTRFLADVPTAWDLEPPEALACAIDLEDVIADFGAILAQVRAAPFETLVIVGS